MGRRGASGVALGCVLTLLPPQGGGHAAAAAAHDTAAQLLASTGEGSRLVARAVGSPVSTSAANTLIGSVLRGRTRSRVLGSRFTMTVWDTESGAYVYRRRASASLRGASTTKILTSVGVLATLGPDHRFPTTVRAGATPDELVLVAGGDPLLTSADLRALASSTAAALGALPAPTPPAPTPSDTFPSPSESPLTRAGPSVSTGSTARSSVSVPAADPGTRTIVVRADDSLFTGAGRSRGWRNSYLPGQVRPVGPFARDDRQVRDATADAGRYFVQALTSLGVRASYAGEAIASPGSATLATFPGHSVAQAVSRMLLISDNDTAEMLFRHVAVARGLPGDWAGARQGLADTLRDLQVPLEGVRIIDGSGLSLDARLTAPALTSALSRALSTDHPALSGLRGWLPVAGRTGTLRAADKRFTTKPARCAAGRIQAKTGTVADSIALAGYADGADGQTKIFVSIVNSRPTRYTRLTTRRAIDRVASSVTGCW